MALIAEADKRHPLSAVKFAFLTYKLRWGKPQTPRKRRSLAVSSEVPNVNVFQVLANNIEKKK